MAAAVAAVLVAGCSSSEPAAQLSETGPVPTEAGTELTHEGYATAPPEAGLLPPDQWPDPDELPDTDDGDDWTHLRIFPTHTPSPAPEWTPDDDHGRLHDHQVPMPDIADPDDPYPIDPPDLDEVDHDDPESVAAAFGCHWFVAEEDASADEKIDRLAALATDELAEELDSLGGATEPGEWYEAELIAAAAIHATDDAATVEVLCHTRSFYAGQFESVAYDQPVHLDLAVTDDGWRVAAFEVPARVQWHPEEVPPGH